MSYFLEIFRSIYETRYTGTRDNISVEISML